MSSNRLASRSSNQQKAGGFQLLGAPGLFQELEDVALIDGRDHRLQVGVAGEEHAHRLGIAGPHLRQKLHAGDLRHALVRHDDMDFVFPHQSEALLGILGAQDLEFTAQKIMDGIAHVRFVIDDQEGVFLGCAHSFTSFNGR